MKNIGVIGATGNMGSAITRSLFETNSINIFSRNTEKLEELASELSSENIVVAEDIKDLLDASDIVILALPYNEEQKLANEIKESVAGKIVISISNPLSEDYSDLVTGWDTSSAEQLQATLSESHVIKAFNTIFASRINDPVINGIQIDHFFAGNDENALNEVKGLISSINHNPILVGTLEQSRLLERMAFLNIKLSAQEMFQWNSAFKLLS